MIRLDRASNFREFRDALRYWDIAAQNIVYADVDGNIGYQATGLQPIRARGHGLAPVPGWTDEYEWTGFIPFERLPYLYNPEKGYIATANAPSVGPEYPYFLGSEFAFGERARRIRELIEADKDGITIEDMQRIHADVYDQYAAETGPLPEGAGPGRREEAGRSGAGREASGNGGSARKRRRRSWRPWAPPASACWPGTSRCAGRAPRRRFTPSSGWRWWRRPSGTSTPRSAGRPEAAAACRTPSIICCRSRKIPGGTTWARPR